MIEIEKPPYGNTGAQNTDGLSLRSLVDWVSCTFSHEIFLENVFDILGLARDYFREMETGKNGYKRQLRFGNISILYDGQPNMGIHVEMTGQGCREFERLSCNGWEIYLDLVRKYGHFTRVDLAIDDFEGYFTIKRLISHVKRGLTRSKFKKAIRIEALEIESGKSLGNTLYFGSPTSRIKVRFYDKLNERLNAGKQIEEGVTIWNRSEIELRDERADLAIDHLLNTSFDLGAIITGILKQYISFLVKDKNDSNKGRWLTAKWWNDFLGESEKLKLTLVAPDRTVERVHNWLNHQVSTSLGMLFLAYDSNTEFLVDMINEGMDKLKEKDFAMIDAYKTTQAAQQKEWENRKRAIRAKIAPNENNDLN